MKELVLVTGGAGFIGSHLCEKLIKEGFQVISLDDYSFGKIENHIAGVEYRQGHTKDVEKLITETPQKVYHLGEYARVEQSFEAIDKVIESNILGTAAVLEFVRKKNCKLIYAGSSTKFAVGEATFNSNPYAWTKAKNTEFVIRYSEWFNISYAITYFYNVYGPRERSDSNSGTLIAIFTELARQKKPLQVRSPGTQRRNFTHVTDIVSGLFGAGEYGNGDGYELGHPDSYSILEVAQMFGGEIEMLPERPGNRVGSELSTQKSRDELGWVPKHSLPEYISSLKL